MARELLPFRMDLEVPGETSSLALQVEQHARLADPTDADVLKAIWDWFDARGVAWSGTPAELAMAVDRPAQKVVHAIEAESISFLIFGIAASLLRRSGSPTMISLHRLEKIWTPAEDCSCESSVTPQQKESDERPKAVICSPEVTAQEDDLSASQWLGEDLAKKPIAGDGSWRDKPVLLTLSPADEPPRTAPLKALWIVHAIGVLFRTIFKRSDRQGGHD